MLVKVQIGQRKEEVYDREKQEKDRTKTQTTDDQTHIMDGMNARYTDTLGGSS